MRARRPLQRPFVIAIVASVSLSAAGRGAANPPPPRTMPDPPISPPVKTEAPHAIRKHVGGCFAYFPSGGVLPVNPCPPQFAKEPMGEAIERDDKSGKCTFVPLMSWTGGSMGPTPCPLPLTIVAKAGVLPAGVSSIAASPSTSTSTSTSPASSTSASSSASARPSSSHAGTGSDNPPAPEDELQKLKQQTPQTPQHAARLDTPTAPGPQQVGCGGCKVGLTRGGRDDNASDAVTISAASIALACGRRARRRARRV